MTTATSATSSSAGTSSSRTQPGSAGYGPTAFGTCGYDGFPATFADYLAGLGDGDHVRFHGHKQPAYIHHNAYGNGATPYGLEDAPLVLDERVEFSVVDDGEQVHLEIGLPEAAAAVCSVPVTTGDLPPVRFVGADFDGPDGAPVAPRHRPPRHAQGTRDRRTPPGPSPPCSGGRARVRVW